MRDAPTTADHPHPEAVLQRFAARPGARVERQGVATVLTLAKGAELAVEIQVPDFCGAGWEWWAPVRDARTGAELVADGWELQQDEASGRAYGFGALERFVAMVADAPARLTTTTRRRLLPFLRPRAVHTLEVWTDGSWQRAVPFVF